MTGVRTCMNGVDRGSRDERMTTMIVNGQECRRRRVREASPAGRNGTSNWTPMDAASALSRENRPEGERRMTLNRMHATDCKDKHICQLLAWAFLVKDRERYRNRFTF